MTAPMVIALAAGGTGGHMVPAHALDLELRRRGHRTMLLTDARGADVPALFADTVVHRLDSGRMAGGPVAKLRALFGIWRNIGKARAILVHERPDAVVGFGGYPTLPAVLAAHRLGIAACLHEQNAVLGRANRLLARRAGAVALSFLPTARAPARAVLTGNPVREEVAAIAADPWPRLDGERMLRLLVIGGSLGARVLSDVVPDALALLPPHLKSRLQVTQQCRAEDLARVRERYQDAGIAAELASYFEDLPERLRWAHLVIARAGASTIAELTAAGRPAILVPLPIATDDHQSANARRMDDAGAGWLIAEPDFTARDLAKRIQRLALEPARLAAAAEAARKLGRPQAAAALADLVEEVAQPGIGPDVSGRRYREFTPEHGERRLDLSDMASVVEIEQALHVLGVDVEHPGKCPSGHATFGNCANQCQLRLDQRGNRYRAGAGGRPRLRNGFALSGAGCERRDQTVGDILAAGLRVFNPGQGLGNVRKTDEPFAVIRGKRVGIAHHRDLSQFVPLDPELLADGGKQQGFEFPRMHGEGGSASAEIHHHMAALSPLHIDRDSDAPDAARFAKAAQKIRRFHSSIVDIYVLIVKLGPAGREALA